MTEVQDLNAMLDAEQAEQMERANDLAQLLLDAFRAGWRAAAEHLTDRQAYEVWLGTVDVDIYATKPGDRSANKRYLLDSLPEKVTYA